VNLSGARVYLNRKPGFAKDLNHLVVRRDDFSFESLNAVGDGNFGQLAQQQRSQSTSLELIGDGKRNLGAMFVDARIKSMTDNVCFGAAQGYQAKGLIEVSFAAGFSGEGGAFGE